MPTRKPKPSVRPASPKESAQFMDQLKQFVRAKGPEYLRDKNVSSLGIGYKQKDGKSTGEICLQFTVDRKAEPQALAAMSTAPLPKAIVIDGVEVPTDIVQRSYRPGYLVVAEAAANIRKRRIDPIVPGVSVANRKVSAGTIGCIVFDRADATPYVLSNWHVLHGADGQIGDDVVQPGSHDDNRLAKNRLGKLIRSHLGAAGDCAIASIEDRAFRQEIMELGVKVEQMGEAGLGDKVVKSGRTTGVTHGVVTRIHTIAKIDYGGSVGERSIGGFEIGPDQKQLASDGEISQGGDSGSVWMFKTDAGRRRR